MKTYLLIIVMLCGGVANAFCNGIANEARESGEAAPYGRWLAIGNSITRHGPRPDLKWEGEPRGMAASSPGTDYIALLTERLRTMNPGNAAEVNVAGRLGRLSSGTMEVMLGVLAELRAWEPDLVTIQLGENDSLEQLGEAGFEERYRAIVDAFAEKKGVTIVCTGVWSPGGKMAGGRYAKGTEAERKEALIAKICREKGLIFVSVAPFAGKTANFGDGATAGVRWHPNDAGMKAYADAIANALKTRRNAQ